MRHLWCIYCITCILIVAFPARGDESLASCQEKFTNKPSEGDVMRFTDGKFSQSDVDSTASDIAASVNSFGFDLYRTLQSDLANSNIVASPLSISLAFSVLYEGAGGNTKEEIARVLRIESSSCFSILLRNTLESLKGDNNGNELSEATRLFVDRSLKLKGSFKASNGGKSVSKTSFQNTNKAVKDINKFVAKETRQQIPKLLSPGSVSTDTVLAVVNALFFKGMWAKKFDKQNTLKGTFTGRSGKKSNGVEFMNQEDFFKYARLSAPAPSGVVLELPYIGGHFSMYLAMPHDPNDIGNLIDLLSYEFFRSMRASMVNQEVQVKLPKFEVENSHDLHEVLPRMVPGMREIFTDSADLSGISNQGLQVDQAVHKAKIKVTEQGTEAVAATAILVQPLSAPPSFEADKPFLYFITDNQSGMVLFTGSVMEL